jgi:hypothetical protein
MDECRLQRGSDGEHQYEMIDQASFRPSEKGKKTTSGCTHVNYDYIPLVEICPENSVGINYKTINNS